MNTQIAIVGMGCRFAGAPDLDAYWTMTLEGRDGFGPVPADRWSHEQFYDSNPRATDKSYAPNGGFIDDIRSFPALTLGIPPRRVEVMDPQQRLSIEMALAAIQDAGYRPGELPRRTGVFVGVTASEWRVLVASRVIAQFMASGTLGEAPEDLEPIRRAVANIVPSRPYSAPGVLTNMIAAAVAQELDLHGPAYSVDAACASGMVALADAVNGLISGDLDCALAGGVYLAITPEHHVAFSRIGAISRSGHCLPFDARADGFVQGDGGGAVVLKRLEDAQRDGDRVYAVLRGIALNNDGRGDGPMAPVLGGQVEVIQHAWKRSGVDPESLGYVETHGTGTSVGDATEFTGLMQSVGDRARHTALGSSKANVGHTMSAAGIAGVIRTALAVHHGTIPPMAGFQSAKPDLGLDGSPFRVPTRAESWDGPRVACVSSFGFGGTNVHAVFESAPRAESPSRSTPAPVEQAELLVLSAGDDATLRATAGRVAGALAKDPTMSTASVARALAVRTPLKVRLALVVDGRDHAITQLKAIAAGEPNDARTGESTDTPSVAFLFPGQGAQRVGMLSDARSRFPVIAETLSEVESEVSDLLAVPLTQLLYPEERSEPVDDETAAAQLTDTAHCQPVMFACSLALQRLLASVGVRPSVVTGHSLGEFNAAVAGGVVTSRDAARFVAHRGRAMADVTGDPGTMAAVMAERPVVESLLAETSQENGITGPPVLANVNHPRQLVVSGPTDAIGRLVDKAASKDISAKPLTVSHAFHSPVFAGIDATPWLEGVELHDPELTVASCIEAQPYSSAQDARDVFVRHATSPVEFTRALEQCHEAGADLFLQVGAGGPLASFARGTVGGRVRGIHTLGGRRDHDAGRSLLEGLGWLWVNGVDLDVRPITAKAPVATLPPEILPRETYWAVKDKATKSIQLKHTAPIAQGAQDIPSEAPADPASTPVAPAGNEIQTRVMEVVAKVSAYPLDALKPGMRLIDDLGFDSLMVGDLATGLAERFPGLGGIPQELLIGGPTVQDLIDYVEGVGERADAIDDDAPLSAWRPTWVAADRLGPIDEDLRRRVALLLGSFPELDARLQDLGMVTTTDPEAPADVVFCTRSIDDEPAVDALIKVLATQIDRGGDPDLVVRRTPGDAEAVSGVVRSLAAERDVRAKSVHPVIGTPADAVADLLVAEWRDADRTPDVRIVRSTIDGDTLERQVQGFEPAPELEPVVLGADDTVLITGGTRGIGRLLAEHFAGLGCTVLALGRKAADIDGVTCLQADVTNAAQLADVTKPWTITAVIHAAGVLADGPIESVDPRKGALVRAVKVGGWRNALSVAPEARVALGIGSWAGRFGNRHQVHYAAANAQMAADAESSAIRAVVAEFGPWTDSDMVRSIPAPIQGAMRAEGVDFVGNEAGLNALLDDLQTGRGVRTHGRDLPHTTRTVRLSDTLTVESHPYLSDHAIEGTPVLPLAAATDLMAYAAGLPHPFVVEDLRLFQGVRVTEPTPVQIRVRGDRAEIRVGARKALAYRARIVPFDGDPSDIARQHEPITGGDAPGLALEAFYDGITFHGPMLQGITAIDAVGPDFVRGRVRTSTPKDWIPASKRPRFSVDPLALDSVMQLSGYVAWTRFKRAGTPVGFSRLVQLAPLPNGGDGELIAEVRFGEQSDEDARFTGTLTLRSADGTLLLVAEDAVAELRKIEGVDSGEATDADGLPEGFEVQAAWVDPSSWEGLQDIDMRIKMADAMGISNPYFTVHEGTARNTTHVEGRELINFSSYNYLGLSGDPRVVRDTQDAVATYGTSVSASRVASGERPFHGELERLLAQCQDSEDALVFTAGHATNVTTIGHLMGPRDLVLHDEFIHDSALQGIKLAGCARRGFAHDDPDALERQLKELRTHYEKVLIVVEGVYSMDGDICRLPEYIALKKKYGCLLMCDEAHSFGVIGKTGRGASEHFGVAGSEVDIWMGTLSKSVASCGGWIAGSAALIRYLRYTAPGFVYSAGITAANGIAALSSLKLMVEESWRVEKLQANAQLFHDELVKRGVDTGPALGGSAVIPAITGNSLHALLLSQKLVEQGINVQPIVYPAVAEDAARLRFFLSSTHTDEELVHTAEAVATTLARVREDYAVE